MPEWIEFIIKLGGLVTAVIIIVTSAHKYLIKPVQDMTIKKLDDEKRIEDLEKKIVGLEGKNDAIELELSLNKESQQALLHDRIYQMCTFLLHRGYTTVEDLENLKYLFEPYRKGGGNGTAQILYDKVKELPIRKDSD